MQGSSVFSVLLILLTSACVDRINFDIGHEVIFTFVIDGHITDQPGPYTVKINSAFDIESKLSPRTARSVKRVVLSDNKGEREELSEVDMGIYQTDPNGIRGKIGRAYTLRLELVDGRIYESLPDTLNSPGTVDSIYFNFVQGVTKDGATKYGFDIFFNSSAATKENYYFLWRFTATFQSDTRPTPSDRNGCTPVGGKCNYVPLCSGLLNVGGYTFISAVWEQMKPCECCTCWYNIFNPDLILSDNQLLRSGRFLGVKAYSLPLSAWYFQHKVHVEISQMSLSRQTFDFWKAVKAQKTAANSLFQPITGKVPSNFVELTNTGIPMEGLFYAAAVTGKSTFITREDVPNPGIIPDIEQPWFDSCLTLFPNGTTTKPSFWVD